MDLHSHNPPDSLQYAIYASRTIDVQQLCMYIYGIEISSVIMRDKWLHGVIKDRQ